MPHPYACEKNRPPDRHKGPNFTEPCRQRQLVKKLGHSESVHKLTL